VIAYEYRARLRRVVDGDTVDLDVDLGFYLTASLRFRVLGIDTPELRGGTAESKARAREAKDRVEELLSCGEGFPLMIRTRKADSFGRWLAAIYYPADDTLELWRSLAETLIAEGLGVKA